MNYIGKRRLSHILEVALVICMIAGAGLMAVLPWLITWRTGFTPEHELYPKFIVILSVTWLMVELLFWQARGILHNVNTGSVFSMNTVRRMRVMAIEAIILATFYFFSMFWFWRFFMAALFLVFVLAAGVCLVFSELFRQATHYKEENDMTI